MSFPSEKYYDFIVEEAVAYVKTLKNHVRAEDYRQRLIGCVERYLDALEIEKWYG